MKTTIQLFFTFMRIGAFTLGGGYAMLDMIESAVVNKRRWINKDEFWDMITVVQMLPGVFAVNTALYTGYKIKGVQGAAAACLGAVIPSFVIILLIAAFFLDYKSNPVVERVFKGIRPCVVALILSPSIKMLKNSKLTHKTIAIPLLTVLISLLFNASPVYIIMLSLVACVGTAYYQQRKKSHSR
ncbi:MAG: chromate transporter [Bacteroidales bacterium]|nr:chromate transporter [Bacteroidales bacterium]